MLKDWFPLFCVAVQRLIARMATDLLLLARGFFRKLALAKKRAAMETEKMSVQKVRDIFEEGPSQADLKPK
jgi:hypothetical protein